MAWRFLEPYFLKRRWGFGFIAGLNGFSLVPDLGGNVAIQKGKFGMVEVVKGNHRGEIGYYDDVDDNGRAVVYFGRPFESEWCSIPHSFLIKTEKRNLEVEEWARDNPEKAKQFGVPIVPLPVIDHESNS